MYLQMAESQPNNSAVTGGQERRKGCDYDNNNDINLVPPSSGWKGEHFFKKRRVLKDEVNDETLTDKWEECQFCQI